MRKVLFILAQLSDEDVDWLCANGQTLSVVPDTIVIEAGQRLDTMYVVLDGELLVSTPQGRRLASLSSGEIVGEMSMVDANPTAATVSVLSKAELLAIPHECIRRKLAEDVGFASRFYKALTSFLVERMRNTISQFAYDPNNANAAEQKEVDELDTENRENIQMAEGRLERLLKSTRRGL